MTSPLQQKIKITGPSMVTANRTWDGVVIYRTASNGWSTDLAEAAIVRNADDARALLLQVPSSDPCYASAQERLKTLAPPR